MEKFTTEQNRQRDMSHIKGWGIDADPKNDPTYPMKQRQPADKNSDDQAANDNWTRPAQQDESTEILHSIERPNLTAVYGNATPPTGLSGIIRRFAFKYSEGSYGHWLPLLLADRVDMVEGLVSDLAHGHVPNVCAESGMKAQWQHDPKAVVNKLTICAVAATAALLVFRSLRK